MATWAQQSTLTPEHAINVVSSGTHLYYVAKATTYSPNRPIYFGGDIYQYNLATGAEVKIIDQSNLGLPNIRSIAWFKGDLYLLVTTEDGGFPTNTVTGKVYRWTGSVDGITEVYEVYNEAATFPDNIYGPNIFRLYSDGETLAGVAVNDTAISDIPINIAFSSADGSSWSAGSLPFTAYDTFGAGQRYTSAAEFPENAIYEILYDLDAGAWKAVKFSGGSFALHQATLPVSSGPLLYTDPDGNIHWNDFNNSDHFFNLAMSTSTQSSPGDISAILPINMPYSVGIDFATGDLYSSNDGNWAALDTASFEDFGATTTWIVRADNADVFIIGRNGNTGALEVWKRSEGIPFALTGGAAVLYWGRPTANNAKELIF